MGSEMCIRDRRTRYRTHTASTVKVSASRSVIITVHSQRIRCRGQSLRPFYFSRFRSRCSRFAATSSGSRTAINRQAR